MCIVMMMCIMCVCVCALGGGERSAHHEGYIHEVLEEKRDREREREGGREREEERKEGESEWLVRSPFLCFFRFMDVKY